MEGVDAQGLRDLQELDYVQAALAAFEFRDVRLGTVEPLSKSRLSEAGALPSLDQQLAESGVCWGEDGLCQTGRPGCWCPNSVKPNLD
jgi:hypothetical protein